MHPANDHGRAAMLAEWNFAEADFDRWANSPAGVASLAKLRTFFANESRCHPKPEFVAQVTLTGTRFFTLKKREVSG